MVPPERFVADRRGGFASSKIAGEETVGDDRRALRGHAFVIVAKGAQARAMLEARIGHHIDDVGAVAQLA